jgi:hypothetical protein
MGRVIEIQDLRWVKVNIGRDGEKAYIGSKYVGFVYRYFNHWYWEFNLSGEIGMSDTHDEAKQALEQSVNDFLQRLQQPYEDNHE